MKKLVFLLSAVLTFTANAQDWHPCYTHDALMHMEELHPGYINQVNEVFERAKVSEGQDRATVYTVPVVVHIVYENAAENLHDSVIFDQIARLNEDYRRMNADTANLRDTFNTIVGDSYIEFQLADFDPDGNPTTGITRTETTVGSFIGIGGFPAEGVKATANGGIDPWDQTRYLNIWVCDMSIFGTPSLLGYATPPDGLPNWPAGSTDGMSDGVVIQYQAFGSNNPNALDVGSGPIEVLGRTAAHEVGHYLGLRHIWADGDCTEEDGVDDTPNAVDQSNQDCDTTKNTCVDAIGVLGDLPDMVENYMDYSAETCQNSFTLGQIDLMRGVLETERLDLIQDNPAVKVEEFAGIDFDLYPNPSTGAVHLKGMPEGSKTIQLYTETGKLVKTVETNQPNYQLTDLQEGFYMLTIQTEMAVSTKRLMVINQ